MTLDEFHKEWEEFKEKYNTYECWCHIRHAKNTEEIEHFLTRISKLN